MPKIRELSKVREDIEALDKEIQALKAKAESEEGLTPEEAKHLDELVSKLEASKQEEVAASANERYAKIKADENQVQRTLPMYVPSPKNKIEHDERSLARSMSTWLGSVRQPQPLEKVEEMRKSGFDLNSSTAFIPMNFNRLNIKNRAIMNTGGSGVGSEWVSYKAYSDKVFDHLTYDHPLLGYLNTETVSNGTERYHFDVDDTSLEAVDNDSETNTTIGEAVLTSGRNEIKPKTINTKAFKASYEQLQDNPFNLEQRITKAIGNEFSRKIAKDVITGSGNGVTDVEGILSLVTELDDVDSIGPDEIEELVDSMPDYYRDGAILISNAATKAAVKRECKDTTGRTLFDKPFSADTRFESIFGHVWVPEENVPDDQVLFINPNHVTLVFVNGQYMIRFNEKYAPLVAWFSMLRFGMARTGSSSAFYSVKVDAGS